jgi:hypothetical protein
LAEAGAVFFYEVDVGFEGGGGWGLGIWLAGLGLGTVELLLHVDDLDGGFGESGGGVWGEGVGNGRDVRVGTDADTIEIETLEYPIHGLPTNPLLLFLPSIPHSLLLTDPLQPINLLPIRSHRLYQLRNPLGLPPTPLQPILLTLDNPLQYGQFISVGTRTDKIAM